ncbi:MAG: MATE family efflux transporter [Clostridia bacterium]|nr:MATE family efflux transporter [Clostridia bacterium]
MAKKLDLMDRSIPVWKLILTLAWPTIVEQLLQTAVNYVDTAMVGSIGTGATAAIGVTTTTIWLINGLMNGLGVGFSVMVARRIGEGRFEDARAIIRQAMLATVAMGLFLTVAVELVVAPNLPRWMGAEADVIPQAVGYFRTIGAVYLFNMGLVMGSGILRCTGDTKTPLKYNLMTNVINVVGNFLLIYPTREIQVFGTSFTMPGAGWGVVGAAAATALATAFSGGMLIRTLFKRESPTQIHLCEDFRPQPAILRQAIDLGVPTALERATISLGQIATTAMITGLGTVSLAANQLANAGESLCYMPVFGFSVAGTTLVAQHLGAGNRDHAFLCGRWCLRLAVGVMLAASTVMFLFATPIIDLFTNDPQVIALGAKMLRIEAFAEPFLAVGTVLSGVLRGAGDTRFPFYVSIAGMWCVRVPGAFLLIHLLHWDLTAVWGAMAVDWLVRGGMFLWRFYGKKWISVWENREKAGKAA